MSDSNTPSASNSTSHNPHRSARASIALIVTSLFTFLLFVFLSVYRHPSRRARPTPSRPKSSAKRKPKLWEVCLDEDPHTDFSRLDGAVCNWQPITAWKNYRLGRRSPPRNRPHPLSEQVTQAWFHHTPPRPRPAPPPMFPDHRTLNVAVLIAMPSRRPPTEPTHGTAPHHSQPIRSRLSYGEGQLSIGTTTVSCSRRVLSAALADERIT